MQFTIAAVFALAAAVSAAPSTIPAKRTVPSVTISLSNDASGANGAATILADGNPNQVQTLFQNSPLFVPQINDEILATSAQLTSFPQGVSCIFQNAGKTFATLNVDTSFVEFSTPNPQLIPTRLSGTVLICEV